MKKVITLSSLLAALALPSCTSTLPQGRGADVESLERQSPVTPDPNVLGNAINGANAVNYSNGGRGGLGGLRPLGF